MSLPAAAQVRSPSANSDEVKLVPCNASGTSCFPTSALAGHVVANEKKGNVLFYWFARCTGKTGDAVPLLIWLNGGPGASSMAGLFWENGPFALDEIGQVAPRPYTWNDRAHVLYWDNPVGTGFSYNKAGSKDCYVKTEKEMAYEFVNALQAFYDRHPEFAGNPLYLSGESYAGKYLPNIALEITYRNIMRKERPIPLKGVAIGDGWMEPIVQCQAQIDYAFQIGMLDAIQRDQAVKKLAEISQLVEAGDFVAAKTKDDQLMEMLAGCGGGENLYDVRSFQDLALRPLADYLNSPVVKGAFNVPAEVDWQCSDDSGPVSDALAADIMQSATDLLPILVDYPDTSAQVIAWHDGKAAKANEAPGSSSRTSAVSRYAMLFYTGMFDLSCGFVGTEKILRAMSWRGTGAWAKSPRKVWYHEDPAGTRVTLGCIKQVENLAQIDIPGAGHMVPVGQPETSHAMIARWLGNAGFPSYDPLAK